MNAWLVGFVCKWAEFMVIHSLRVLYSSSTYEGVVPHPLCFRLNEPHSGLAYLARGRVAQVLSQEGSLCDTSALIIVPATYE